MVKIWTPEAIPWDAVATPLAAAEDAVARLDERLAKSPIREGWIARTHFSDACDSRWLAGELVHLEDLVLHNARMDVRAPTHEITRAHAVLRARRRIAEADPGWTLTTVGLDALRGRAPGPAEEQGRGPAVEQDDDNPGFDGRCLVDDEHDLADEFAAIEAAVARSERFLAGAGPAGVNRDPLVYEPDWDEDDRLAEWRAAVDQTKGLPPVLAAAIALDAWDTIEPLQNASWLGQLLAAALLRARAKTRAHLTCLNSGLRIVPRARRRSKDNGARLVALIESFAMAADKGMQDHDRWVLARRQLERKLEGRRSTSKLPGLIDFVMSRPIVSAGMIAKELSITARAAQDLVAELGLREATGKGRYRAWGVL